MDPKYIAHKGLNLLEHSLALSFGGVYLINGNTQEAGLYGICALVIESVALVHRGYIKSVLDYSNNVIDDDISVKLNEPTREDFRNKSLGINRLPSWITLEDIKEEIHRMDREGIEGSAIENLIKKYEI